jgi:nitrate reductase cytochrome c-type subunit
MRLPRLLFAAVALAAAEAPSLPAADAPGASPAPAYAESRDFSQPIRANPVGTSIAPARAFLGAPPVMPHNFAGDRDGHYCLECHALKTRVEKRQSAIAPVPHAEYSQCQQCHVNGTDKSGAVFRESEFVGLDLPGKGTRAHPLAPPTIPHKTFMRDNCAACHGPAGKQKIVTTHPYRSQCQQCHVSDATKNYDRPVPWGELEGAY